MKGVENEMKRVYECAMKILQPISTVKICANNKALESEYYINYVYT